MDCGLAVPKDHISDVLAEFARTLVTDFPIQGILDHLVLRIVEILPVDAAGVSLISGATHPWRLVGSDESATCYEDLQLALGEGPCFAAYEAREAIAIPDLRIDRRFPRFGERALVDGLVAVFTFPLRHGGRCLGALDLYRTTAGSLSEVDMSSAQTLANAATAYVLHAGARAERAEFLETLSHELRTPMTSVSGYVERLVGEETDRLTTDQVSFLKLIKHNSDRFLELADDLLEQSSLASEPADAPWSR